MTNAIDSKSVSESHVIQVPEELAQELWERLDIRKGLFVDSWRDALSCAAQWGWDQREHEVQERAD
jgi:hypothetical protein